MFVYLRGVPMSHPVDDYQRESNQCNSEDLAPGATHFSDEVGAANRQTNASTTASFERIHVRISDSELFSYTDNNNN
jgi:hypothetical protein